MADASVVEMIQCLVISCEGVSERWKMRVLKMWRRLYRRAWRK